MGDARQQPKSLARQAAAYAPSAGIFGPTTGLDHRLFNERFRLRGEVAEAIMHRLDVCIRTDSGLAGSDWQDWTRVYLTGGSASEWAGDRPNDSAQDLDVIVAIDLKQAQGYNAFEGMDAGEVASALNRAFWARFNADNWHAPFGGVWNLTAFCNQRAWDISQIRPYAAWSLTDGHWAVKPPSLPEHTIADFSPAVLAHARAVAAQARAILRMDEPLRTREATALWEHVHEHRCQAFSPEGSGWDDPGNVDEKYLAYHPHHLLQKIKDLALAPKTASREDQLAEMDPGTRASALAQEHVRMWHPKLTTPVPVRNGQSSVVLSTWLAQAGHPGAPVAYITEHPNPGVMSSNTGRGPDGEPVVVLHPERKDYGTLAHETAHLITDHETGRQVGEPHGPDGAHDDHWAGHYARLLNNLSAGAGDDFLAERDSHRSAMQHEAAARGVPFTVAPERDLPHDFLDAYDNGRDSELPQSVRRIPIAKIKWGHQSTLDPGILREYELGERQGDFLPEALQVGEQYHLNDGHHRVQIAHNRGRKTIRGVVFHEPEGGWDYGDAAMQHEAAMEGTERRTNSDALPSGAGMVYLSVPHGKVQGGGEHHVTLAYLPRNMSDEHFDRVSQIVQDAASRHERFRGVLEGGGTFPEGADRTKKRTAYVPLDAPAAHPLQKEFDEVNRSHYPDYSPHITRGYLKPGDEDPEPHPRTWVNFTHVHVRRGDEVRSFPLRVPEEKTPPETRAQMWQRLDTERRKADVAEDARQREIEDRTLKPWARHEAAAELKVYYHGTPHAYEVGQVIPKERAYYTPNRPLAATYSPNMRTGHVYTVEPLEGHTPDPEYPDGVSYYASKVRVTGEAHNSMHPQEGEHWWPSDPALRKQVAAESEHDSHRTAAAGGPWYHGTDKELNPGDLIEANKYPRSHKPYGGIGESGPRDHTYFSSDLPYVTEYYGPNMYEVEPLGSHARDPEYSSTKMRRSKEPLRVVRKVHDRWGIPIEKQAVSGYDGLGDRTAMIYLELPPGTVRPVPGGVDDHHITVVYLGKNVSDEKWAEACRRAQAAAAQCPPMEGVLRGIDIFPPSASSDGKVPAFVPAYVGGIGRLRRLLEDLSASEHKDYRPHVTLAYLTEGDSLPEPHPAVPLRFTHVHCKRGHEIVSYPLTGGTNGA